MTALRSTKSCIAVMGVSPLLCVIFGSVARSDGRRTNGSIHLTLPARVGDNLARRVVTTRISTYSVWWGLAR